MTDREARIKAFLSAQGWGQAERRPLADDASFRRYERLRESGRRAILMDAPPPRENVVPFLDIDATLCGMGFSAPEIFAEDRAAGLLLLEDFGDATYTSALANDPACEAELYTLAVDTLIALHRRFAGADGIPPYDLPRLMTEANLLVEWYYPAVYGRDAPPALCREFEELWRTAFDALPASAGTLVLRDYHVDNLMWLRDREGVQACGLLDFQDAVIGHRAYDMVSLLEDARRDVPGGLARTLLDRYLGAFPEIGPDGFRQAYAMYGAQRSTKILGIFTRLDRRDGKPVYLKHIARVWRWLEGDLSHPALAGLKSWFDREFPTESRIALSAKAGA
ncbi:MAG: phosphotransferase [Proteobacteria bacterium]|nr:phosphotransferase [Pseudomonadota bacterium]